MSDTEVFEQPAPARTPSTKTIPPPFGPVTDRWVIRGLMVALVWLLLIAVVMLFPRWQGWLPIIVAAALVSEGYVAVIGVRTNKRRELIATLTNHLQFKLFFPVRIKRVRWKNLWVAAPARFILCYPDRVRHSVEPHLLAGQLAAACSRALETSYAPSRHTARGRLTLVKRPLELHETTELDVVRDRIRQVVHQLLGKDAVASGFTTDESGTAITAFGVKHSAGIKLANQLFQIKVTRILSAMLPGKWRAHFDLETDEATFRLRPPLPIFVPRPVLPCEPGTQGYFELPQAVDEDGNMQVWDISGVMTHTLKVGRTRTGKALSLQTSIPTVSGWSTMGSLRVGDLIFDQNGQPTTVLDIFDQPPDRPCYEIEFSDGSTIVADAEHFWFTEDRAARISQRVATQHESKRSRTPRLDPELTASLRRLAVDAKPDELMTVRDAAQLGRLVETHPWIHRVALTVGAAEEKHMRHRSFTYREQTVRQTKSVKIYPAGPVYTALAARARSRAYPRLHEHEARLHQLAVQPSTTHVTARDLSEMLVVPLWQARRWLQHSGVAPRLETRTVELQVAAKTIWRGARPARQYPASAFLTALADSGDASIRDQRAKTTSGRVRTTREISETLTTATGHLNHSVPVTKPLVLPEAILPIPPYTLGAWLGDGTSRDARITSADPQVLEEINADGYPTRVMHLAADARKLCREYTIIGLRAQLRKASLLKTHRDQPPSKRIPAIYLRASIEQRRALLAGLLDTDGTVSPQGTTQFTTVLPGLADDVLELARSLGYRATRIQGRAKLRGNDHGPKWTIAFTTTDPLFRLQRKLDVLSERTRNHNRERTRSRSITAVRRVPSEPMRCITVDSPSHLYLAGHAMIPTHNTVSLIGDAVEAARRGFRVLVIDPKRVEFLGLRDWPNVEVVATTVQDQIAVIHSALELMHERYRRVEEEGAREADFERVLLIIDEYRQFYANVKGWWASIKITGMPAECPVFEWVGGLLRMAGACGIHVDLGTQRPDAEFLKGEALAVDTPIPTPTGWTTMGNLEVSQSVLDEHGQPLRVSAVTDVAHGRPCYRVVFSDGSSIVADANHQWAVVDAEQRTSDLLAAKSLGRAERYPHHSTLATQLDSLPHRNNDCTVRELEAEIGGGRQPLLRRALHDGRWALEAQGVQPAVGGRFPARTYRRVDLIRALHGELTSAAPTWRRIRSEVLTTAELAHNLNGVTSTKWSVLVADPLTLPAADLPIDPWLLGYWLGDGARGAATIATADAEILERIQKMGYRVKHYARYNYGISSGSRGGWNRSSLQRSLREQGLLYNKHVPAIYLRASEAQRAQLLAGLLDADGTCSTRGRGKVLSAQVSFSNTNRNLIDSVYELAATLGFIPTVRRIREAGYEQHPSSAAYGRPVKAAWVVNFTADRQVFGLSRKQRVLEEALRSRSSPPRRRRYITSVEPVESVPVRCITVESPTHLYLAGTAFVATHNCRDNFSARMSTGRLSPDGAQMMYDTPHIGTTVPLNVRGRATMIGVDDVPREVQVYYTPDPRRATSIEDRQLLDKLKPASTRHPRRKVLLGDADAARAELADGAAGTDGAKPKKAQPAADEWLEVLTATLVPWTDDTTGAEEHIERADVEVSSDDEPDAPNDPQADYEPPETVRARRVRPDMLLQLERDRWVCVTAVDAHTEDEAELQLIAWRDDDDNEGVQEIGTFELVQIRRPANGTSRP